MQGNNEPIKDEEMDKYVSRPVKEDFHEKLKELIKETAHGNRILLCADISNVVSLEALVKAYEKNIGYDFSKGDVTIDEFSLERAANPLYEAISKELGIEITSLSDKQLREVVTLKKNNIANPGEYLRRVRQMYEEGTITDKQDKDTGKRTKDIDIKDSKNRRFIFTEKAIARAKEINIYDKSITNAGGLTEEAIGEVISSTISHIEETKMSKELKNIFYESIDNMRNNYNLKEIELIRLCKDRRCTDGFSGQVLDEQIRKYIGKNKKLQALYKEILGNPKEIPQKYIDEINSYEDNMATSAAISAVSRVLGKGIEDISEKDKKDIVSLIIAGTLNERSILNKNEQVIEVLEALCPDLNLEKDGKKDIHNLINDNESLANLKKYLPLDEDRELNSENIKNVVKAFRLKTIKEFNPKKLDKLIVSDSLNKEIGMEKMGGISILRNIGDFIQHKLSDSIMKKFWDKNVVEIDVNELIDEMDKSVEEKFFEGSNLRFTDEDKKSIQNLYINSTDSCWISSKEQYLNLKFASLYQMEHELNSKFILSKLEKQRLDKIQDSMRDFYEDNPDFNFNNVINFASESEYGELNEETKKELADFEDNKVKSKLMTTFIKDSSFVSSIEDYKNLNDDAKKEYLKNTITALTYAKTKENDSKERKTPTEIKLDKLVAKFAQRRLEIISDEDNKFFETQEIAIGYIPKVYEDRILEEYNKYTKHHYKRFEDLEEYCNSNKKMYVVSKLDEYKNLKEEDFEEAIGETAKERVMFIESKKFFINEREKKAKKNKTKHNSADKENNNKKEVEERANRDKENNSAETDEKKLSKEQSDKEEKSDLPVPITEKQGFFKRLFNKVIGIFTNDSKSKEDIVDSDKKDTSSPKPYNDEKNGFDGVVEHYEVNTLEAVRITQENSNNMRQRNSEKSSQQHSGSDDVVFE